MPGPAWFSVNGGSVQPFAIAPWGQDSGPEHRRLPNILKNLRGEWVCVPFGIEGGGRRLPGDWPPIEEPGDFESLPHGRSSNAEWQLAATRGDRLDLILTYPEPQPVRLLRRSIWASDREPRLHMSLMVEVRRACQRRWSTFLFWMAAPKTSPACRFPTRRKRSYWCRVHPEKPHCGASRSTTRCRFHGRRESSRPVSYGCRIAAGASIRGIPASGRSPSSPFAPHSTSGRGSRRTGAIRCGGQGCLAP